jgi:TonB family protein
MSAAHATRTHSITWTATMALSAAGAVFVAWLVIFPPDVSRPPSPASSVGVGSEPCVFREPAFREGVRPPRAIRQLVPDVSDLPAAPVEGLVIVEARIDATGTVTEDCLLKGVRADIDQRALEAVRRWKFEPPRLIEAVDSRAGHFDAGSAVPVIMTVTVPVSRGPQAAAAH